MIINIITGYLIFSIICWLYIVYEIKNAPTDIELLGKEIE